MEAKYLFDDSVLQYEKMRPTYGTQIFKDVIKYAQISSNKSLLEIGCGTGQATKPFLKTGAKVTAVELGENLAAFTAKKFKTYKNFNVVCSPFEDYTCEDNSLDMVYSATAFHWLSEEVGYNKAYNILKNGGTLALFWNRPSANDSDNPVHQKIQAVYHDLLPHWSCKVTNGKDKEKIYSSIIKTIEKFGFTDLEFKLYHNTRKMTGAQYIELLSTYSDHLALEASIRLPLFERIRAEIEALGNEIIIHDTVDLYLAKKPL